MHQSSVFWFWLPLFASWLLTTVENPIITAFVNRLPNQTVMLAAMGVTVSLSAFVESPSVSLLTTITALVENRQSYLVARKYVIGWIILLTTVTLLISFTRLFDVIVVDLMKTPEDVAQWVQLGIRVMCFWSAFQCWRRLQQGILIRFGRTRRVVQCTIVRLVSSGITATSLLLWRGLPGIVVGTVSLMVGALMETIYATIATRPILNDKLCPKSSTQSNLLNYHDLLKLHLPLSGTTVLALTAQPIVLFCLARLDTPTKSLAAWPIVFQVTLLARATSLPLPEVIVSLVKEDNLYSIRDFCLTLAAINTLIMTLFAFTPIGDMYLFRLQHINTSLGSIVGYGIALSVFQPALSTITYWIRGLFVIQRRTVILNAAMAIQLFTTVLVLLVGILGRFPGIPTAVMSLNIAAIAQLVFLSRQARRVLI